MLLFYFTNFTISQDFFHKLLFGGETLAKSKIKPDNVISNEKISRNYLSKTRLHE